MTNTQEIYELAAELTNQEVENVLAGWEHSKETKKISSFNSLVSLGDSRELSMATVILQEKHESEIYNGYYS